MQNRSRKLTFTKPKLNFSLEFVKALFRPSKLAKELITLKKIEFLVIVSLLFIFVALLSELVVLGSIISLLQTLSLAAQVVVIYLIISTAFNLLFVITIKLLRFKPKFRSMFISMFCLAFLSFLLQQSYLTILELLKHLSLLGRLNYILIEDVGLILIYTWQTITYGQIIKLESKAGEATQLLISLGFLALTLFIIGT